MSKFVIQPAHSHHTLLYVAPRAPPSSARSAALGNPLSRCPAIRSSSAQSAALGNPLSHHPLFIRSIRCPGQSAVPLNPLFIRSIRCPGQSAVPQSALHPLNPLPRAIRCPTIRSSSAQSAAPGNPLSRQSALHPLNPLPWAIRCPAIRSSSAQSAAPGNPLSRNPLFIRSIRCPGQSAVPLNPLPWAIRCPAQSAAPGNPLSRSHWLTLFQAPSNSSMDKSTTLAAPVTSFSLGVQ